MATTVTEATDYQSPINAALKQGVGTVSLQQEITFTLYVRLILPLDGYAFWVRADLVSQSALFNVMGYNAVPFNNSLAIKTPASVFTVQGSLHYATEKQQVEDETYAINRVIFTSEERIEPLNDVNPNTLWIAEFNGLTFGFGSHGNYYEASRLWHYTGDALYADMQTQVINKLSDFDQSQIVSNSLPIWLSMNNYVQKAWEPFGNIIPLYPSFLVPQNISPPWGSVHIASDTTLAIGIVPYYDDQYNQWQLTQEHVRVTLYGVNNSQALAFAGFVQQWAANYEDFGIMNIPTVRDEKRTQREFDTISKKKTIEFDINYYQSRTNTIARQLIKEAIPQYFAGGVPIG